MYCYPNPRLLLYFGLSVFTPAPLLLRAQLLCYYVAFLSYLHILIIIVKLTTYTAVHNGILTKWKVMHPA